jgi:hypothetical protein
VQAGHKKFITALSAIYGVHRADVLLSAKTNEVLKAYREMFPGEEADIDTAWKIAKESFLRTDCGDVQVVGGIFDEVLSDRFRKG